MKDWDGSSEDQAGVAVGVCSLKIGIALKKIAKTWSNFLAISYPKATAGGAGRTGGILGRAETLHPRQGILQATSQAGSAEEAEPDPEPSSG